MCRCKGSKFTIIALMVVLTISALSLLISNLFLFNNRMGVKEKHLKAADVSISNLEQLKDFMRGTGQGSETYAGKTVVLTADINCDGAQLCFGWEDTLGGNTAESNNCTFKGIFDGQGHTIYNVVRELGFMNTGDHAGYLQEILEQLKI